MKIKTADLIGPALDWAVAKCLGATKIQPYEYNGRGFLRVYLDGGIHAPWEPSRYWSQGGPIIEREKLEVRANDYEWQAFCFGFPSARAHSGKKVWASGPTPLIAAMRCFVASRLGDKIEIPEELL